MDREELENVGKQALDALDEVRRELGPGLLKSVYEAALAHEPKRCGLSFELQKSRPIADKGIELEPAFRIDALFADELIIELKGVEGLRPIHDARFVNCLRLADQRLGFLANFNVPRLKGGDKRRVYRMEADERRPKDFSP